MKKIVIVASILAVAIGLSLSPIAAAAPAWITPTSNTITQKGNIAVLSVTTGDVIPKKPDAFVNANVVAGFAWADLDSGEIVVTTIHPNLGRDSHQNPDAWHAHTATLTSGTTDSDFCVASINSTPEAGISTSGNTQTLRINVSDLSVAVSDLDGAVGFTINPDAACGSGLGVQLS
ncbi:MAG: hypothetical protein ACE5Q5_03280 [Nitrosarchaeum sp.]